MLNKADTKNILETVRTSRMASNFKVPDFIGGFKDILSKIKPISIESGSKSSSNSYHFDKLVIDAPNLTTSDGLIETLRNLPNVVNQFNAKTR